MKSDTLLLETIDTALSAVAAHIEKVELRARPESGDGRSRRGKRLSQCPRALENSEDRYESSGHRLMDSHPSHIWHTRVPGPLSPFQRPAP